MQVFRPSTRLAAVGHVCDNWGAAADSGPRTERIMRTIVDVAVLQGYKLKLIFDDGREGMVDLSYLLGKGVFSCWQDYDVFERVQIGTSGELVWGDQVDLCPDALYLRMTGMKVEDLFPTTRNDVIHA
jgi:hypothetical protein